MLGLTRLAVINNARARIGCVSFQVEAAPGADVAIATFETVTAYTLTAYPWSWSTPTRRLSRLADAPERYWTYQFPLPSDMLGAPRAAYPSVDCRASFTQWEIAPGRLLTNEPDVWLRHTKRSAPDTWPGYFVALMELALMAEFALSVREDRAMRNELHREAFGSPSEQMQGGLMGVAMNIDAQSKPSQSLPLTVGNNPLLSARFEA